MLDERLHLELENLKTDLTATVQQLDAKTQAVSILNASLEKCRKEKNEFKRMAEQVMNRYQMLKRTLMEYDKGDNYPASDIMHLSTKQLASLLVESREANKSLEHELMNSREKIEELQGDIRVLRKQINDHSSETRYTTEVKISGDDRQTYVTQLEELTLQLSELKRELGQCLDEKQEIATERDIYRNKCDRLNNELNYILSGDERKIQDIDTLMAESRMLKDQIELLQMEKSLALNTVTKYKKLLDRKLSKHSSSVSSESCITPAISPKHQEKTI
ncbi:Coiled-coil domain-containing protein [Schistosoma japonicum]|uniref:Coiled-coil domain-containing protein n=1 Tax=Schistosoma japonicum TaxID=6182 RepID=A0A4Z2DGP7_SCHJA|nr:Coiled-coil domain-containing protein [Schistosoma japonicum]TNN15662.1 Coiled-coil domain-containing protein [Schistosoma japonicum]